MTMAVSSNKTITGAVTDQLKSESAGTVASKLPIEILTYMYEHQMFGSDKADTLQGVAGESQMALLLRLGFVKGDKTNDYFIPEHLASWDLDEIRKDFPELKYPTDTPPTEEMARDIVENDENFWWHAKPKELYRLIIKKDGHLNLLRIRNMPSSELGRSSFESAEALGGQIPKLFKLFGEEEFFKYWPYLVDNIENGGTYKWIEAFKGSLIQSPEDIPRYAGDIKRLYIAAGRHWRELANDGLSDIVKFAGEDIKYYWPGIVALGTAQKGQGVRRCFSHLIDAQKALGREQLKKDWQDLILKGKKDGIIWAKAIRELKEAFGTRKFKTYWPKLKELLILEKYNTMFLYHYSMVFIPEAYDESYWPALFELGLASEGNAYILFNLLFNNRKKFRSINGMKRVGKTYIKIAKLLGEKEYEPLEGLVLRKPEAFDKGLIEELEKTYPGSMKNKYMDFWLNMHKPQPPKFAKSIFPWHEKVQRVLKKALKRKGY